MKISVVGTGYVGLVSGACFACFNNFDVTCIDVNRKKIKSLQNGIVPIYEHNLENIIAGTKNLSFSSSFKSVKDSDAVFICVGTPENTDGSANTSFIFEAVESVMKMIPKDKIIPIIIKSTVPVGTCEKVRNHLLSKFPRKKVCIVSNPEFLREGCAIDDFTNPDRIVIGFSSYEKEAKKVLSKIYQKEDCILYTNTQTAELVKYASNTMLAARVVFANEIADISTEYGADVHVITNAMGLDHRIGPDFLTPSPGYGGSCFPKDVKALSSLASSRKLNLPLIKSIDLSNTIRKKNLLSKIENLTSINDKDITILGLAFKNNTDDFRESATLDLIDGLFLESKFASITLYDPKAKLNSNAQYLKVYEIDNMYKAIEHSQIVIIMTDWDEFSFLRECDLKGKIVFDFRNIINSPSNQYTLYRVGIDI